MCSTGAPLIGQLLAAGAKPRCSIKPRLWGCAIYDEVEPSAVVRCYPRRRGFGEPVAGQRVLSKQAGARAGMEGKAGLCARRESSKRSKP